MKIMIISSAAIPAPVIDSYGGLEAICGWLTLEFTKNGHDVVLATTKGSQWEGEHPVKVNRESEQQLATMNVIGTVDPSWDGNQEKNHYFGYKEILEKEFSNGDNTIVIDHTWFCHAYKSKVKYPNMNLLHVHHGMLGFHLPPPKVLHPRWLGLSTEHAAYMNSILRIPVRHVHNGIPLVQFDEGYDPNAPVNKQDYLLSLNRISSEKGIENCIDIALSNNMKIVIAGDDTKVGDQHYVNNIIERCRHSNGMATYLGLVDNNTKNNLILKCKALIACPKSVYPNIYIEAFGLYAIEAQSYFKPVLAVANGGLKDIIQHGVNGYLAPNPELLKQYVPLIDKINPLDCRRIVEERFSKEVMAQNYLNLFQSILNKEDSSYW